MERELTVSRQRVQVLIIHPVTDLHQLFGVTAISLQALVLCALQHQANSL
jgi:hypothetical protein